MKKMGCIFISLLVIFLFSTAACTFQPEKDDSIEEKHHWVLDTDENGKEILRDTLSDKTVVEAWQFDETGKAIPLDMEEYLVILRQAEENEETSKTPRETPFSIVNPLAATVSYIYEETSSTVVTGTPKKVTIDMVGPCTITQAESITITDSFSTSVNSNAEMKKQVKLGASFTWEHSLSSTTTITGTFPVPAGKTGYLRFIPKYRHTSGNLKLVTTDVITTVTDLGTVWGQCPKKLDSGLCDGVLELVTYNT